MAQVVTNENIAQFMETGKVDEFKPPVDEVKTEDPQVATEAKDDATKVEKADEQDDVNLTEHARKVIGKKHREMKEAEEFAEREYAQRRAAEKRADELDKRLKELEEKSRPAPVEAKEPKQEDFATVQEYIEALADYKVDKKLEKNRIDSERQKIQEQAQATRDAFTKRIAETMKELPDFEEVTSTADVDLPQHITQHILESDMGPLLGYHLAKNRDELNRILNLSPIRAIAELGKLEASLEKKPAKDVTERVAVKSVSKAPAPITPIEGKSAPVNPDLNRDMPYSEYKRLKQQQAGKR